MMESCTEIEKARRVKKRMESTTPHVPPPPTSLLGLVLCPLSDGGVRLRGDVRSGVFALLAPAPPAPPAPPPPSGVLLLLGGASGAGACGLCLANTVSTGGTRNASARRWSSLYILSGKWFVNLR